MNPAARDDQNARGRVLYISACLCFALLAARLFYLQVTTFADYARESDRNRIAQRRVRAPRGLIYASGGEALALNRIIYSVTLERCTRSEYDAATAAIRAALGDSAVDGTYSRNRRVIRLKRDVSLHTVAVIEELVKPDHPKLAIEIESQRYYPCGHTCSHLLGYMGVVQEEDLAAGGGRGYAPDDFIGKTGLERQYEAVLRGVDGVRFAEVDAAGRVRREFPEREQPAVPGEDLRLTIDLDVQRAAEKALPDSLPGAVVALDPRSGAILALASRPDFDPNVFVSTHAQEERRRVLEEGRTALLNRALNGRYCPGSTIKMVAAVAALEEGFTDTLSTFPGCRGALQVGSHVFHCMGSHGELNLLQALEVSCNIYFLHLAQLLGMDRWRLYAARFGFGQPTGFAMEPPESAGLLPSKEYHRQRGGWALGHLMNLAIGQGALVVTPIQMARYTAAIANGGYLVQPHVCGDPPPLVRIPGVSPGTLRTVRKGMHRVVNGWRGTGRRAHLGSVEVAGKTGTAQGPREDSDAWFVAFAPYVAPTIAVAAVVEGGGSGGATAAPVVRAVLEAYFATEEDSTATEAKLAQADSRPEELDAAPAWALR